MLACGVLIAHAFVAVSQTLEMVQLADQLAMLARIKCKTAAHSVELRSVTEVIVSGGVPQKKLADFSVSQSG